MSSPPTAAEPAAEPNVESAAEQNVEQNVGSEAPPVVGGSPVAGPFVGASARPAIGPVAGVDQPSDIGTVQNIRERGIDLGIVVYGPMDAVDAEAVRRARAKLIGGLRQRFPQFRWRVPLIRRPELSQPTRVEPVALLQHGVEERDVHGWDFGILVTGSDLIPHYKSRAMGVVARLLDLGVVSTARVDPFAFDETESEANRLEGLTERLHTLMRHVLGHLCGLANVGDPENLMYDLDSVGELDRMADLEPEQQAQMASYLESIDDARLEEEGRRRNVVGFYARSIAINYHEIFDAVRHAEPWEFPRRLSRITTAAVSSVFVLMITAESWDLALSQQAWPMVALMFAVLLGTTAYVIQRQRLLRRREHRRLTEQLVISNISTVLIVLAGMASVAAVLLGLSVVAGVGLFHPSLVSRWAGVEDISWVHYAEMSLFVTSLGLFFGALGASFEDHYDVRHITFVDEET